MAISPVLLRAIVSAATDKRVWKRISVLIAAILIPIILTILMIVMMVAETEEANQSLLDSSFTGAEIPEKLAEQREAIENMQEWLGELDGAISEYDGDLDAELVKASFYCLNFGEEMTDDEFDYNAFCECFEDIDTEQLETALQNVSEKFPQYEITEYHPQLIQEVYKYLIGRQNDEGS